MILRVIGRGSCKKNRGRGEESMVRERMRDEDARWVRYSGLRWDGVEMCGGCRAVGWAAKRKERNDKIEGNSMCSLNVSRKVEASR